MYELCYGRQQIPTVKIDYIPINLPDNTDIDEIINAHDTLLRRLKVMSFIDYVDTAYNEYAEYKNTVSSPSYKTDIALEIRARSFFLEFDIFLDHWSKYMSFRNKKTSFKMVLDKETHAAFDSSDAYALAAIIRNYAAHYGDIIQGKFWGGNKYDVGCSKDVLLDDKKLSQTKRDIINRQPAQLISFSPIMQESLVKLKQMHETFLRFDIDQEDRESAITIRNFISTIDNLGMLEKRLYFVNQQKLPVTTCHPDGTPIETILATEYKEFNWKDYSHVIDFILSYDLQYKQKDI